MKKVLSLAILTLVLTQTHTAFADSYSRTPSGNGTYQEVTFNVTIDDVSSCASTWGIFGVQFDPVFAEVQLGDNAPITENTHTFTAQFNNSYNFAQVTAGCDGSGGSLASLEYIGLPTLIFSTEPYVAPTTTPTTTPTGGAISFIDFNDITPTDMLASVRQGTIDTADKTLPLLVFLGIPLGFLLVLFLINLINQTLTPETTAKRGNGRGWTANGALEHDLTAFKKKERSRIKRGIE